MELYATKTRWKWLLFVFAALIFLVIIFYSNRLIKNVAQEERRRMALWADAISYRAELVNHTESFFDQIRIEEGKRAAILGKAWQKVNEASLNEDVTFYVDIMSYNSTIPCILTCMCDGGGRSMSRRRYTTGHCEIRQARTNRWNNGNEWPQVD